MSDVIIALNILIWTVTILGIVIIFAIGIQEFRLSKQIAQLIQDLQEPPIEEKK